MFENGTKITTLSVGIDLGDEQSQLVVVDAEGRRCAEKSIPTTPEGFTKFCTPLKGAAAVLEVGTHSPWVSRLLTGLGLRTMVCDPTVLRRGGKPGEKNDVRDARRLAELLRMGSTDLRPVEHRGPMHQADWAVVRGRAALVECRTRLVNSVRGLVKVCGMRLPGGPSATFWRKAWALIPPELRPAVRPMLRAIAVLSKQIDAQDERIAELAGTRYPETKQLQAIPGVGALTALTFALVVFRPERFRRARSFGKYLGVTPKQDKSGNCDPQLGITKAGNPLLRRYLVQSAHYILGAFGPDCDLRTWGKALAARGGKNAKKRAIVAVTRRLGVKMLAVWKSGQAYDPNYDAVQRGIRVRAAC